MYGNGLANKLPPKTGKKEANMLILDKDSSVDVTSRNENVPEVEHYISTVKERIRAIENLLPFKRYPPSLIV